MFELLFNIQRMTFNLVEHLEYETIKNLKEAGYEFNLASGVRIDTDEYVVTVYGDELVRFNEIEDAWFYTPTLLELIAACGNRFGTLTQVITHGEPIKWVAKHISEEASYEGATPAEAVAAFVVALLS